MVHSTPPILNEFETETESVFEKKQRRKKNAYPFQSFLFQRHRGKSPQYKHRTDGIV